MSDRGSGRTTRQLAALPNGAVYLVHSRALADYCRGLLEHAGRDPRCLHFVTPDDRQILRGWPRNTAWDVDHACLALTGRRGLEAVDEMEARAPRG